MNDRYLPAYMEKPVGQFLAEFNTPELERLAQTLKLHLASKTGGDDLSVDQLLQFIEFELIHRD